MAQELSEIMAPPMQADLASGDTDSGGEVSQCNRDIGDDTDLEADDVDDYLDLANDEDDALAVQIAQADDELQKLRAEHQQARASASKSQSAKGKRSLGEDRPKTQDLDGDEELVEALTEEQVDAVYAARILAQTEKLDHLRALAAREIVPAVEASCSALDAHAAGPGGAPAHPARPLAPPVAGPPYQAQPPRPPSAASGLMRRWQTQEERAEGQSPPPRRASSLGARGRRMLDRASSRDRAVAEQEPEARALRAAVDDAMEDLQRRVSTAREIQLQERMQIVQEVEFQAAQAAALSREQDSLRRGARDPRPITVGPTGCPLGEHQQALRAAAAAAPTAPSRRTRWTDDDVDAPRGRERSQRGPREPHDRPSRALPPRPRDDGMRLDED